jgi:hypothetical protein
LYNDFKAFKLSSNGEVVPHLIKAYDIYLHRDDPNYEANIKLKEK